MYTYHLGEPDWDVSVLPRCLADYAYAQSWQNHQPLWRRGNQCMAPFVGLWHEQGGGGAADGNAGTGTGRDKYPGECSGPRVDSYADVGGTPGQCPYGWGH